jgi:hypothetical protein
MVPYHETERTERQEYLVVVECGESACAVLLYFQCASFDLAPSTITSMM